MCFMKPFHRFNNLETKTKVWYAIACAIILVLCVIVYISYAIFEVSTDNYTAVDLTVQSVNFDVSVTYNNGKALPYASGTGVIDIPHISLANFEDSSNSYELTITNTSAIDAKYKISYICYTDNTFVTTKACPTGVAMEIIPTAGDDANVIAAGATKKVLVKSRTTENNVYLKFKVENSYFYNEPSNTTGNGIATTSSSVAKDLSDEIMALPISTTEIDYTTASDEGTNRVYAYDTDGRYFRGEVNNNYLTFAANSWRIWGLDKDGNIIIVKANNLQDGLDTSAGSVSATFSNNWLYIIRFLTFQNYASAEVSTENYNYTLKFFYDNYIFDTSFCADFSEDTHEGNFISSYTTSKLANFNSSYNTCPTSCTDRTGAAAFCSTVTSANYDSLAPSYDAQHYNYNKMGILSLPQAVMAGASLSNETNSYLSKILRTENGTEVNSMAFTSTPSKVADPTAGSGSYLYYYYLNNGQIKEGIPRNPDYKGASNIFYTVTLKNNVKVIGEGTKANPYKVI